MFGNQNARKHHIDKATLEDLYVGQGLSVRAVEKVLKCRTIHRLLVKYGIPRRDVNRPRTIPTVLPTTADAAYAAGFFDGEGSINIRLPSKGSGHRLVIHVAQANRLPLEWLRERWGGSVRPLKRPADRKPVWEWTLASKQAKRFLEAVLVFLIVKRAEAVIAVDFQGRRHNPGKADTADERARDKESRDRLHALRGPKNRKTSGD
jgi:hypothetical protein